MRPRMSQVSRNKILIHITSHLPGSFSCRVPQFSHRYYDEYTTQTTHQWIVKVLRPNIPVWMWRQSQKYRHLYQFLHSSQYQCINWRTLFSCRCSMKLPSPDSAPPTAASHRSLGLTEVRSVHCPVTHHTWASPRRCIQTAGSHTAGGRRGPPGRNIPNCSGPTCSAHARAKLQNSFGNTSCIQSTWNVQI